MTLTARPAGCGQRLGHDLADGSRAAPALRAAPKAPIDLTRGARRVRAYRGPHGLVSQNIAGTDNHSSPGGVSCQLQLIASGPGGRMQMKRAFFQAIPNWLGAMTLAPLRPRPRRI